jgi:DNA-binding GntR family transcriptional regulator
VERKTVVFEASENLPEQVARAIGDRIIRNQLKPGERILEAKLAEAMGVSRSPLREALRILEKQKLVELIPRKGAKVTKISASHIIWFYDIFEALYALVARESAENADDEDRSALRIALQKIEKAAADRDIEAYYSAIFEFAAVGLKAARNPLLEAIMLDLWPNNRRIQFASLSLRAKELRTNVRFFQEMHQCVIDGEPSRVEAVVRAYARNEKAFALKIANGKGPWPQEE